MNFAAYRGGKVFEAAAMRRVLLIVVVLAVVTFDIADIGRRRS